MMRSARACSRARMRAARACLRWAAVFGAATEAVAAWTVAGLVATADEAEVTEARGNRTAVAVPATASTARRRRGAKSMKTGGLSDAYEVSCRVRAWRAARP